MSITRAGTTSAKCNALQCETLDLGLEGFSECPQVGPNRCEFAVPFGYAFLCRHRVLGMIRADGQTEESSGQGATKGVPA